MNLKSEQLRSDLSLEINYDDVLSPKKIKEIIINCLGRENCSEENFLGKNNLVYRHNGLKEVILFKSITYLGGKHLLF